LSGVTSINTVTYSGTIVSFVGPITGTYSITADGAEGGSTQNVLGTAYVPGGPGGEVSGTVSRPSRQQGYISWASTQAVPRRRGNCCAVA
jgi:hypothetical protein